MTQATTYATPLGPLFIDRITTSVLKSTEKFSQMTPHQDEDEHSIEMHLPYVFKRLQQTYSDIPPENRPPIVPILVGSLKPESEKEFGEVLAPYLRDPANAFVVSSDFCHWGSRFSYCYYKSEAAKIVTRSVNKDDIQKGGLAIYESIENLDREALDAIETGEHDVFLEYLKRTGNTVCGRHPIGVVMAGLEKIRQEEELMAAAAGEQIGEQTGGEVSSGGAGGRVVGGKQKGMFKFVRYEQSSKVTDPRDSSVSYASAYAII